MMKLRDWFEVIRIQFAREEGQTMAEYGMLVALIAVAAIVAVTAFGGALSSFFSGLGGQLGIG
jgi:pilus assembly protein Flp/PilA